MLKAVANKDIPILKDLMLRIFNIELSCDPETMKIDAFSLMGFVKAMSMKADPEGRIRIYFIEGIEDLSNGRMKDTDIIGFNMLKKKLVFVAIPNEVEPISLECGHGPVNIDSYLAAVTLHEVYENLTGDIHHCRNPGKCINSICKLYENGTCCVCMAGLIESKYPNITAEDLFCEEDLHLLNKALKKYGLKNDNT
jgi:hypothetical protein